MERIDGELVVSATDLVGHLACGHLTVLHGRVALGVLEMPVREDPELEVSPVEASNTRPPTSSACGPRA